MPIEIKELHIRVEVSAQPGGSPAASPGTPATGAGTDLETVVAACVEQVMQVLRDRRER